MALAHYQGYVENVSTGKALEGAVIRVYSYPGAVLQPVFADLASTPKPTVSTNANGAFDFYIADGNYDIEYVSGGVVLDRLPNVPILNPSNYPIGADVDTILGAAAATGHFGTFTGTTIADNSTAKTALQALETATELRPTSATLAASGGSGLSGHNNTGTGAIDTTIQKKLREEASLWDVIPDALRAAIEAGTSTTDVISYINQALLNYKRVIVRNGVYRLSTPALLAFSGQRLEFEDDAWFHPLNDTTNGIAVPHNLLDCVLVAPGLIGETALSNTATGILWNSNAGGTAPFGSATSDDMGGRVEDARFKQASGTKGWNNFFHLNMAGSVEVVRAKGRGLIGTASDRGYGIVCSGRDLTIRDIDFDSVVASQGRHGIYLGDQCFNADISGFTLRNFRKSGFAANTSTTASNARIRICDGLMENVAADVDASATNGAFGFDYQGAATSGGVVVNISDVQISSAGAMGGYFKGYADLTLENVTFLDWGAAPGGSYSGVRLEKCDRAALLNVKSRTAAANNGANLISHIFVQESSDIQIRGGGAYNSGSGAQRTALSLNATGIGTPNTIIDRFVASKGSGSWSASAYDNPTQNGSTIVFAKQGSQVVDTQTGADITLDASDGQSVFVLDAGATSVLQILPAGVGQIVTLRMTGATTIKQNNIYSPSAFAATNFDTNQLVCGTASGSTSLWYEIARSVN